MTKEALHPKRDLVDRRPRVRTPDLPSSTGSPSNPSSSNNSVPTSPEHSSSKNRHELGLSDAEKSLLKMITRLTSVDVELRRKKMDRFRSHHEAVKLTKAIRLTDDQNDDSTEKDDIRIVVPDDTTTVTSGELYSMLEWAQSLPFYRKMPVTDRICLLRKFAVYQLILEYGYATAKSGRNDAWLFSNGSCMPRFVDGIPIQAWKGISADRRWRQEKLYTEMTNHCIDDVAMPLRRLDLKAEEFLALKLVMLCQCGDHFVSDSHGSISDASRKLLEENRSDIVRALFTFYRCNKTSYPEERFGNLILAMSGIVTAATFLQESYQLMRLFGIVPFDRLTQQLLFCSDSSDG
ncbi:Nuclear hormone receptor family member nhr-19 [Aphelenchoides avenae]|nr:Nuclear hormone receptor family member nhr-19 [Aphelenchus avenae]